MLTKEIITEKLKSVSDPELRVNIVDLGLIYNIEITPADNILLTMTLTSPGCPLSFVFNDLITDALKEIKEVKTVKINLTFDPPWDPGKMSEEVKAQLGWMG